MKRNPRVEDYLGHIEALVDKAIEMEEYEAEEREESIEFFKKHVEEHLTSYNGNFEELRCCYNCKLPMKYNSMAYQEGYHFDSCI